MLPWVHLATAQAPGGGDLRLMRRGDEFAIRLGTADLMNSRFVGSEQALATLALARLTGPAREAPRVLIGGLGMGFTLRAAQAAAGPAARLTVAELVPEVVDWARGPMAALHGDSLSDPRLTLVTADVAAIIAHAAGAWDAILLDVDNGPEGMTRAANDGLYGEAGLAAARRALARSGILAVWSVAPDAGFTARLRRCGFDAEAVTVRTGRSRRGARHVIWLARRP